MSQSTSRKCYGFIQLYIEFQVNKCGFVTLKYGRHKVIWRILLGVLVKPCQFQGFESCRNGQNILFTKSIGFINETNWNVSALPLWNQLNYDNIFSEDIICCNITL